MSKKKSLGLTDLRGMLLGLEMSLSLLEQDLDTLNNNITYLNYLMKELTYNIKLHKSGKVVTVLNEYHKSVEELSLVQQEIIKYKNLRHKLELEIDKKCKTYDYYLTKYIEAYEHLGNTVILPFKKVYNESEEGK